MGDYNPISFKYLSGWGGEPTETAPSITAGVAASLDETCKLLRKYSRKDREYLRDEWRKLYLFYVDALLEEDTRKLALNDGYLKKIDKQLDLL